MSMNDHVSDLITRIRNSYMARHKIVKNVPSSRMIKSVLDALIREGYVHSYEEREERTNIRSLDIKLKYYKGNAVIQEIKRISKPSRRIYLSAGKLDKYSPMLGIAVISTPKGVLSSREAKRENVGGEIVCSVF